MYCEWSRWPGSTPGSYGGGGTPTPTEPGTAQATYSLQSLTMDMYLVLFDKYNLA